MQAGRRNLAFRADPPTHGEEAGLSRKGRRLREGQERISPRGQDRSHEGGNLKTVAPGRTVEIRDGDEANFAIGRGDWRSANAGVGLCSLSPTAGRRGPAGRCGCRRAGRKAGEDDRTVARGRVALLRACWPSCTPAPGTHSRTLKLKPGLKPGVGTGPARAALAGFPGGELCRGRQDRHGRGLAGRPRGG